MVALTSRKLKQQKVKTLLASPEPTYDWLIPGLLERTDRVIITGREGKGKSTLLRQIGYRLSIGQHPFTGAATPNVTVVYFDLENSVRQYRRACNRLKAVSPGFDSEMVVVNEPEGLNVTKDRSPAESILEEHHPDLVILGPMYKLAPDLIKEDESARVAAVLDSWRAKYNCAIIMESHQPHEANVAGEGRYRPERPFGSSLWLRWPEFGYCLEDSGVLRPWRGPREERDWPEKLRRGEASEWPWMLDVRRCLNCNEPVEGNKRFCDDDCEDEYKKRGR